MKFQQGPRTLYALFNDLYSRGDFTYGDLAEGLTARLGIPLLVAQRSVLQIAAEHHGLSTKDVEMNSPTIAETMANFRAMADIKLKPKRSRRARPLIPQTANIAHFEIYRPKPAAKKWLLDAPDHVIACYDNPRRDGFERYTIVLGTDRFWSAQYAYSLWRSGMDPRLLRCWQFEQPISHPTITMTWNECLRSRTLGNYIPWLNLPEHARMLAQTFE